jgi:replication factor C large subunit
MSQTTSLFGGTRLILIDDINLMKEMKECEELVEGARNPVIAITEDSSSKRLKNVKQLCENVCLRRPLPASIAKHLNVICKMEGVTASPKVLEEIAKNAGGDVRSAVNDLEMLAAGRKKVDEKEVSLLSERDRKTDVYSFLGKVYGGGSVSEIVEESWDLDEQPESLLFWIDENVARVYGGGRNLAEAISFLARADVFLGRITSRQYWGFLRYAKPLMCGGVRVSRPERVSYGRYMFPSFYGALGRTKKERNLKKSVGLKASHLLHVSSDIFSKQYVGLYRTLLKSGRIKGEDLRGLFDLTDEDMELFET